MAKHSDRDARAHRLGMVDAQQGLLNRRHGAVLVILCGDDAQVLLGIRHNVSRACSMAQSSGSVIMSYFFSHHGQWHLRLHA